MYVLYTLYSKLLLYKKKKLYNIITSIYSIVNIPFSNCTKNVNIPLKEKHSEQQSSDKIFCTSNKTCYIL